MNAKEKESNHESAKKPYRDGTANNPDGDGTVTADITTDSEDDEHKKPSPLYSSGLFEKERFSAQIGETD